MKPKHQVVLSKDDEKMLQNVIKANSSPRTVRRSTILLLAAENKIDSEIASKAKCHVTTVERVRHQFVKQGLEKTVFGSVRQRKRYKVTPKVERDLVELLVRRPPVGREKWTLRVLAAKLRISMESVRLALKRLPEKANNRHNQRFAFG